MSTPNNRKEDISILKPLSNTHFPKNIFELYEDIHFLDVKISKAIYDFSVHYKLIYYISKAIEFASDTFAMPVFFLIYGLAKTPSPISYICYVVFFMLFTEFVVKRIFHRKRPAWTVKIGFAFPSSHSLIAALLFTTVLLMPIPYKPVLMVMLALIPPNRIMLGHHYIADVSIGILAGTFFGLLWVIFGSTLGLP